MNDDESSHEGYKLSDEEIRANTKRLDAVKGRFWMDHKKLNNDDDTEPVDGFLGSGFHDISERVEGILSYAEQEKTYPCDLVGSGFSIRQLKEAYLCDTFIRPASMFIPEDVLEKSSASVRELSKMLIILPPRIVDDETANNKDARNKRMDDMYNGIGMQQKSGKYYVFRWSRTKVWIVTPVSVKKNILPHIFIDTSAKGVALRKKIVADKNERTITYTIPIPIEEGSRGVTVASIICYIPHSLWSCLQDMVKNDEELACGSVPRVHTTVKRDAPSRASVQPKSATPSKTNNTTMATEKKTLDNDDNVQISMDLLNTTSAIASVRVKKQADVIKNGNHGTAPKRRTPAKRPAPKKSTPKKSTPSSQAKRARTKEVVPVEELVPVESPVIKVTESPVDEKEAVIKKLAIQLDMNCNDSDSDSDDSEVVEKCLTYLVSKTRMSTDAEVVNPMQTLDDLVAGFRWLHAEIPIIPAKKNFFESNSIKSMLNDKNGRKYITIMMQLVEHFIVEPSGMNKDEFLNLARENTQQ